MKQLPAFCDENGSKWVNLSNYMLVDSLTKYFHRGIFMGQFLRVDLKGKVKNLSDKVISNEPYMPVYEAVINSIQAIMESERNDGKINVRIVRGKTIDGKPGYSTPISNFIITDNGIGFNDENLDAFKTSDTTKKLEIGGKGVGRFTWLKAFEKVKITSIYFQDGQKWKRTIDFDLKEGIQDHTPSTTDSDIKTTVELIHFKQKFFEKERAYKKPEKIGQRILEHFLSYFIMGKAPSIIIEDSSLESPINLNEKFRELEKNIEHEDITIKDEPFSLYHISLKDTYNEMNKIVYCGHSRQVKDENLPIGGETNLTDGENKVYYYSCYVSSNYLDNHVEESRDSFSIPATESSLDFYLKDANISFEFIKSKIEERVRVRFATFLEQIKTKKKQKLMSFTQQNPHSKNTFTRFEAEILQELKTSDNDNRINELFYKFKGKYEYDNLQETVKLLRSVREDKDFKKKVDLVKSRIEDSSKDQLISYLVFRKCIIDLLEKHVIPDEKNNLPKEDAIHDLIFPRKKDSDSIDEKKLNLWILDEKLTFHRYATSDLAMNKILEGNASKNRPDVLVCQDKKAGLIDSITIIEFKRVFRNDEDPIQQLFKYVKEIRDIQKFKQHPIRVNPNTLYFCYAICDIDDHMKSLFEIHNLMALPQNVGYFAFNNKLNAFLEVRAYDRIIEDVTRRHKAFFSKLGLDNITEEQ